MPDGDRCQPHRKPRTAMDPSETEIIDLSSGEEGTIQLHPHPTTNDSDLFQEVPTHAENLSITVAFLKLLLSFMITIQIIQLVVYQKRRFEGLLFVYHCAVLVLPG